MDNPDDQETDDGQSSQYPPAAAETRNKDWQRKQKRLGPAPIASFEDTLDEVRSKVCISLTYLACCIFLSMFTITIFLG